MADVAPPAPAQVLPAVQTKQEQEAGVGVLGWLGFIIINAAIWGIISTASVITWILGFAICFIYTGLLIGLAIFLERKGARRYYQFMNLLWVLAATFVFVLGLYISIQVIGRIGQETSNGSGDIFRPTGLGDPSSSDRVTLLPSNASAELKAWVADNSYQWQIDHASFGGSLYFNGQMDKTTGDALLRSSDENVTKMSPMLRNARAFLEFESKLFFIAYDRDTSNRVETLFAVDAAEPGVGVKIQENARQLFLDTASSELYIKAEYRCPNVNCYETVFTVYSSDGTPDGTVDLRSDDPCASACNGVSVIDPSGTGNGAPSRAALWGVLFVATLPMLALAGVVMLKKKMPGLFMNLYLGIIVAVIVIYLLANWGTNMPHLPSFLKWFLTMYSSLLWVALSMWSLLCPEPEGWIADLKTWAVAFVGVTFFVIVHIDLEIPFNGEAWRWIAYALITIVQMLLSAIVSRTVPMVAGAIGLFVLAWKIAIEIVSLASFSGSELNILAADAIVALQGIGIILGAIWYACNQTVYDQTVRNFVRQWFMCQKSVSEGEKESTDEENPSTE